MIDQIANLTNEQLIHHIALCKSELRKRKLNESQRRMMHAKEIFADTAAAAPAAASLVGKGISTLAKNIQQFGRDYRRG